MDTFYVIKLINTRDGRRGYVMDTPKGIMLSVEGIHPDVTQFTTYQDAQKFMRENKLERHGMTAHIRDNGDMMKESYGNLKPVDKDLFYVENKSGEKLFYDSKREGYFFKKGDVGYPAWDAEEDLKKFIDAYKLQDVIIKTLKKK